MNEPTMTYDPRAEEYLLGALLADPSRIFEAREIVRADDFSQSHCAIVWEAMCSLSDNVQHANVITVADQVQKMHGSLVPPAYVHSLMDAGVYGYEVGTYAEVVKDYGDRRRVAEAAGVMRDLAHEGLTGGGDLVERAAELFDKLRAGIKRKTRPIGDSWHRLISGLREEVPFTPTPWPSLNLVIQGIRPGCLYTVAGASGGGKSVFGLQLALHIAETGGRVGYVSLEMTELDLLKRVVSLSTGIDQRAVQNNALTPEGMQSLLAAETGVRALKLEVFDRAGATWDEILGFARALHRKGDLKLLVVDYFGMVKSDPGSKSRQMDLENWANGSKALAKELGCAVVLLEQLNRDSKDRKDPRPIISDLRGTAALEHAADAVILLHRPKQRRGGKDIDTPFIEFLIAKNRNGEPGEKRFLFEGKYARIRQLEYEAPTLLDHHEA